MNILVVNDDGYLAEGIKILVEGLKKYGNVYVVSPETQQSGASHCITLHTYVRLHERDDFGEDVRAWSIEGTPADCVIYAIKYLELDIDLVVSGINDGPNIATDALYSGTVAGATEGLAENIPSIAISTDYGSFDIVRNELDNLLKHIFEKQLYSLDYVLNVNFPEKEFDKSKGIKIASQGVRPLYHKFEVEGDKIWPKVKTEYMSNDPETDMYAFVNGYISLCPLGLDRTNNKAVENLKSVIDN